MTSHRSDEIERIIEKYQLYDVKIAKLSERMGGGLTDNLYSVLMDSGMALFEYSKKSNCVYITNKLSNFGDISHLTSDFIIDIQRTLFGEEAFNTYIRALDKVLAGKMESIEFEISIFSLIHNEKRDMKCILKRQDTDDDIIVSGIMQDMTPLNRSLAELAESKNLLYQILDSIPQAVFYVDKDNLIEFGNKGMQSLLGLDVDDWKGKDVDTFIAFVNQRLETSKHEVICEDERHRAIEISASRNNRQLELHIDEVKIFDKAGHVSGKVYVHTNITDRIKDIEKVKKLLRANELLVRIGNMVEANVSQRALFKEILRGVIEIVENAEKGCILKLDYNNNLYIVDSEGYDQDYAEAFSIPFDKSFAKKVLNGDYRRSVCVRNVQKKYSKDHPSINTSKRGFALEANITAPIMIEDKLYGIISIDSSEKNGFDNIDLNLIDLMRSKIEISLQRYSNLSRVLEQAQKDALTGLYNRRFFNEIREVYLNDSILKNEPFCLVIFDLDDLKKTNDTYGHNVGDALIKYFASTLMENIRREDILARIGGDEFIGIFRCVDKNRLDEKMEHITQFLIQTPLAVKDVMIPVRFSFGVSIFPNDGENMKKLISVADERMYASKVRKKNKN